MPLGAPTALLPAGQWQDRTPCPAPSSAASGYELLLTFDAQGRLFGLGTSSNQETLVSLWEWNTARGYFEARTACTPSSSWPWFQRGFFGYDPVRDDFLAVGSSWSDGDILYEKPIDRADWEPRAAGYWSSAGYGSAKLVHDERRHSLVATTEFPLERPDGADEWKALLGPPSNTPSTDPPPSPLDPSASAYDPTRGQIVSVAGAPLVTRELDVTTQKLTKRTAAGDELGENNPVMWWDPIAQRMTLLTSDMTGTPPKIWAFDRDAGRWSLLQSSGASKPAPYKVNDFAVEPSSGDVAFWMDTNHEGLDRAQLWRWQARAQTWIQLSPDHWPTLWPQVEPSSSAYDSERDRLLVVTAPYMGRVVITEWDGASDRFTDRTSTEAEPWPTALEDIHAAYDPDRHLLSLLGKFEGEIQLWEWNTDTSHWQNRRTLPPTSTPDGVVLWPADGPAAITYDWTRRRLAAWVASFFPTLLLWDSERGIWQAQPLPTDLKLVGGTDSLSLVSDQRRGRLVLVSAGPTISEWDGNKWSAANLPEQPDLGSELFATYDPRAEKTLILAVRSVYDMQGNTNSTYKLLSWDGERLVDITSPAVTGLRFQGVSFTHDALSYDAARGNLLLVGPLNTGKRDSQPPELHIWEGSTEAAE
jgi:hypothetical protein